MKRILNGLVAIGIFVGIAAVLAVEAFFDVFGGSIDVGETFAATMFGAGIALVGTLFTIYASEEAREEEERRHNLSQLLSAFSRIDQIRDDVVKAAAHQSSMDPRGFLHSDQGLAIRKPSEGIKQAVRFSEAEKAVAIGVKADLYNHIVAVEKISESLFFLETRYKQEFYRFQDSLLAQSGVNVAGKQIFGEFEVRKSDLILLEEIEAHLHRLLSSAVAEVKSAHEMILEIVRSRYSLPLSFVDLPHVKGSVFSDDP